MVHVVQYDNMNEKIQWLSVWDVMSGSTRSAKKYLVKFLQTKQPIYFEKDAAKDLASYIASVLLEHWQLKWSVNFCDHLAKYITKLHPVLFSLYTACFQINFFHFTNKNGSCETYVTTNKTFFNSILCLLFFEISSSIFF